MSRGIIIIGTCGAGLTALHTAIAANHDKKILIVAADTLPVFNPYDKLIVEIPDLEIFETKVLAEFEDHQTFSLDKDEMDVTCAVIAFRDIPLAIPLCN